MTCFAEGSETATDSMSRKLDLRQLLEVAKTKPLLSWAEAGLMDFVLRLPLPCFPWCKHCVLDFLQTWREEEIPLSQAWSRLEGGSHKSNSCVCLKGTGRIFLAALFSAVIYISVMDKCRYFVNQSWICSFRVKKKKPKPNRSSLLWFLDFHWKKTQTNQILSRQRFS